MEIELYLKLEKDVVKGSDTHILPPMTRWGIDRKPGSFQTKKTFIDYSEKGNRIKELLEEIASKHNFELKIYDISKTSDAIHARTKGVHKTPTVIIDNHKFEDDFEMKDITFNMVIVEDKEGKKEHLQQMKNTVKTILILQKDYSIYIVKDWE